MRSVVGVDVGGPADRAKGVVMAKVLPVVMTVAKVVGVMAIVTYVGGLLLFVLIASNLSL